MVNKAHMFHLVAVLIVSYIYQNHMFYRLIAV